MKLRLVSAVTASVATAALLLLTSALAATFTVDSVMDIADANPGDGVCETAPGSGICTLRAAIQEANGLPGSDRIELPAGTYTIALQGTNEDAGATGDFDVLDDAEISGDTSATTIVDAAGLDRILDIFSATVTVTDVTLRNGVAVAATQSDPLAILAVGGGIRNREGTLTLERVVLTDNTANQGGGLLSIDGPVTINDSLISNNTAADLGFTAAHGGGIFTRRSMLRITNSTIAGNTAVGGAGLALRSDDREPDSTGTIVNTTISGNDREGMSIQNANARLFNVTLTENTQFGLRFFTFDDSHVVTVTNSIIADNTDIDCQGDTLVSSGHNLNTDGTCAFAGTGDITGVAPALDALADNGGPTPTHALTVGSPAIDAGNPNGCDNGTGGTLATDQRGEARPVDGDGNSVAVCDIGAFEFTAVDDGGTIDLSGTIKTADGTDICAMVLASGQFMFSCNPPGVFSLTDLPRENDGTAKRQIYADGFFPEINILTESGSDAVVMTRSGTCPSYNTPYDPGVFPGSAGKRIDISGAVLLQDMQTPICAMVLANGQYMFSCDGTGSYALNIPLDTNGQFKLQVYADGFAPTIQTFDEFQAINDVRMARAVECQ